MKKYHRSDSEIEHKGRKMKLARLSDGFSNTKTGKRDKTNKPRKTDDVEFEADSVVLVDETMEVRSITGNPILFALEGCILKVNGKKVV